MKKQYRCVLNLYGYKALGKDIDNLKKGELIEHHTFDLVPKNTSAKAFESILYDLDLFGFKDTVTIDKKKNQWYASTIVTDVFGKLYEKAISQWEQGIIDLFILEAFWKFEVLEVKSLQPRFLGDLMKEGDVWDLETLAKMNGEEPEVEETTEEEV